MADFLWTEKRKKAAIALAEGNRREDAAAIAGIGDRTIYRWLEDAAFVEEVDRLSVMVDIASKAERMRIARRVVKQKLAQETLSDRDLLDWLRFAREETEGIKLDFDISAIIQHALAMAGQKQE